MCGQGPIGGDGDSTCCSLISVNARGPNEALSGDYKLKTSQDYRPEPVCVNGCIYTREGSPATQEYCFKTTNEAPANVQCQVCFAL